MGDGDKSQDCFFFLRERVADMFYACLVGWEMCMRGGCVCVCVCVCVCAFLYMHLTLSTFDCVYSSLGA